MGAMLRRLRAAGEDKSIFCVKFSLRAKFRARSATLFAVATVVSRGFFNSYRSFKTLDTANCDIKFVPC
jgi:hypothetical protein